MSFTKNVSKTPRPTQPTRSRSVSRGQVTLGLRVLVVRDLGLGLKVRRLIFVVHVLGDDFLAEGVRVEDAGVAVEDVDLLERETHL